MLKNYQTYTQMSRHMSATHSSALSVPVWDTDMGPSLLLNRQWCIACITVTVNKTEPKLNFFIHLRMNIDI